jgi:hypothetical protein
MLRQHQPCLSLRLSFSAMGAACGSANWDQSKGPATSRDDAHQGVVCMTEKDAFDLWWEWAEKPLDSMLTIPIELHDAVMALPPDEGHDRDKVNEAARLGLK